MKEGDVGMDESPVGKRGRGRPKGSVRAKNKEVTPPVAVGGEKPNNPVVVVKSLSAIPEPDRIKAIDAFERADEMAIASELKGELAGAMVYRFNQGNRVVTGLSYAGVKAVFRHIYKGGAKFGNAPQFTEEVINDKEKIIRCLIHLINPKTGEESYGIATANTLMTYQDGTRRPDPFAYQKALSKATRNAMRFQIPEITAVKLLDTWLKSKDGKVKEIGQEENQGQGDVDKERQVELRRLYALLGGYVDLNNAEQKKKVSNWIARTYGKRVSEMAIDEIRQVASQTVEFVNTYGKEKLIGQFDSEE